MADLHESTEATRHGLNVDVPVHRLAQGGGGVHFAAAEVRFRKRLTAEIHFLDRVGIDELQRGHAHHRKLDRNLPADGAHAHNRDAVPRQFVRRDDIPLSNVSIVHGINSLIFMGQHDGEHRLGIVTGPACTSVGASQANRSTCASKKSATVPYFVMEYVPQAASIIEFATREALGLRRRLELFLQVCDAVHHGHQKSIIHRDLKPSNLLVDQEGHIKVIDFGIARATDSDIAATTIVTDTGQIVGTLQYMSPEQVDGSAEAMDIRSDIYSLGVVLYELVCDRLPYDVRGATLTHAARLIQHEEFQAPRQFSRHLKGDFETIILTAMERNRERRYQSASELAADIRRFLNREPIMAKPPTPWTRFARLIARHPVAATSLFSSLIAVSIIASAYTAVWYARGANTR